MSLSGTLSPFRPDCPRVRSLGYFDRAPCLTACGTCELPADHPDPEKHKAEEEEKQTNVKRTSTVPPLRVGMRARDPDLPPRSEVSFGNG